VPNLYSPERKFWVKDIVKMQFGKTEWWCIPTRWPLSSCNDGTPI